MLKIFSNPVSTKISPKWIIKDHLATFVDGRNKPHWPDYFTFLILPLIAAIAIKWCGAFLDQDMVGIINTGLALFAGLFLSVSIQLISIDPVKLRSDSAKNVQGQTLANISFLIFISLLSILLSYISLFKYENDCFPYHWFKQLIDISIYWLVGIFMLTVMMVLKRTSILFDHIK